MAERLSRKEGSDDELSGEDIWAELGFVGVGL
jgi:hypothetical protein